MSEKNINIDKENAAFRKNEFLERGKRLIYPERFESWKETVDSIDAEFSFFNGKDLEIALDMMERLNNGESIDNMVEWYKERVKTSDAYDLAARYVAIFSKKNGTDFARRIEARATPSLEDLDKIDKENTAFRKNELLERGKKLIYPERFESWKETVDSIDAEFSFFNGKDLEIALDMMERLNNGESIDNMVEWYKERVKTNDAYDLAARHVAIFSRKNGTDFARRIEARATPSLEDLDKIDIENAAFRKNESHIKVEDIARADMKYKLTTSEVSGSSKLLTFLKNILKGKGDK